MLVTDFREAVRDAEQRRCVAMTAADIATLDALLRDDLDWVHGSGRQDTKQALLADIAQNRPYAAVDMLRHEIRIYDEVAISSGTVHMRTSKGAYDNVFTNIWVRDGGLVGLAASQSTRTT